MLFEWFSPVSSCGKNAALKGILAKTYPLSHLDHAECVLSVNDLRDPKPLDLVNYLLSTLGGHGSEILLQ